MNTIIIFVLLLQFAFPSFFDFFFHFCHRNPCYEWAGRALSWVLYCVRQRRLYYIWIEWAHDDVSFVVCPTAQTYGKICEILNIIDEFSERGFAEYLPYSNFWFARWLVTIRALTHVDFIINFNFSSNCKTLQSFFHSRQCICRIILVILITLHCTCIRIALIDTLIVNLRHHWGISNFLQITNDSEWTDARLLNSTWIFSRIRRVDYPRSKLPVFSARFDLFVKITTLQLKFN